MASHDRFAGTRNGGRTARRAVTIAIAGVVACVPPAMAAESSHAASLPDNAESEWSASASAVGITVVAENGAGEDTVVAGLAAAGMNSSGGVVADSPSTAAREDYDVVAAVAAPVALVTASGGHKEPGSVQVSAPGDAIAFSIHGLWGDDRPLSTGSSTQGTRGTVGEAFTIAAASADLEQADRLPGTTQFRPGALAGAEVSGFVSSYAGDVVIGSRSGRVDASQGAGVGGHAAVGRTIIDPSDDSYDDFGIGFFGAPTSPWVETSAFALSSVGFPIEAKWEAFAEDPWADGLFAETELFNGTISIIGVATWVEASVGPDGPTSDWDWYLTQLVVRDPLDGTALLTVSGQKKHSNGLELHAGFGAEGIAGGATVIVARGVDLLAASTWAGTKLAAAYATYAPRIEALRGAGGTLPGLSIVVAAGDRYRVLEPTGDISGLASRAQATGLIISAQPATGDIVIRLADAFAGVDAGAAFSSILNPDWRPGMVTSQASAGDIFGVLRMVQADTLVSHPTNYRDCGLLSDCEFRSGGRRPGSRLDARELLGTLGAATLPRTGHGLSSAVASAAALLLLGGVLVLAPGTMGRPRVQTPHGAGVLLGG